MSSDCNAKKILIIEDDSDISGPLSRVLSSHGYATCHAADGDEGVRLAEAEKPDLILLDFFLPGKNGFEVYREIRNNSETAYVPIVALTAFGQDIGELHGLPNDGQAPEFADRLEKPFEFNVLLNRLEKIFGPA